MESQYYEHLVHCKSPVLMQIVKVVSVVGFVFSLLLLGSSFIFAIIGCVFMGLIFWYSYQETGKDYEYVYVDGDISFDAIYHKSRRKTKAKTSWEETKLVCRANAPQLEGYRQKGAKIRNFTSGESHNEKMYALVTEQQGNPIVTYFEPAEEMLEMMWRKSPSKVSR